MERCILNQLAFHFTTENIVVSNQYGFRSGKSTGDSLVDLIVEISKALDEECYAVSLFLKFQVFQVQGLFIYSKQFKLLLGWLANSKKLIVARQTLHRII